MSTNIADISKIFKQARRLLLIILAVDSALATLTPARDLQESVQPRRVLTQDEALSKLDLLQKVYWALEKGINFFAEDYSSINVDGIFGMRLAQGSVDGILKDCHDGHLDCPLDLVDRLKQLERKIDHISEMTMPYLEAQDVKYLDHFRGVINQKFMPNYKTEYLGEGRHVEPSGLQYDEAKGDVCLSLVLGTGDVDDIPQPKCTITKDCWDFMSAPDLDNYSITHQLIYFMFLDKTGCEEQARPFATNDAPDFLRAIERRFCRNILGESQNLYKTGRGNVHMMKQDLFLEQSVLCGMLGFEDFFAEEYIRMVLSWQLRSGCYTLSPAYMKPAMEVEEERLRRSKLLEALQMEAKAIEQAPLPNSRKLLRETKMTGDCLAHKTGLALGTLGAYLRFLVEQVYDMEDHIQHI